MLQMQEDYDFHFCVICGFLLFCIFVTALIFYEGLWQLKIIKKYFADDDKDIYDELRSNFDSHN